ncbi:MAG TPA: helix-turn-helix transcriptional regulator [Thermoanaerobaculia bacterium]|nr:helix-turn-helix transcriptional regulator [Thermoanaerobaculia bacterium]
MDEELPARSRALTLLRDLRDWTQQQLADVAGLKRGTISDYERGVEVPSLRKLRWFSDLMGHSEETFRDVLQLVRRQDPPRDCWVGPVHFTAEEERESWRLGDAAGRLEALSYRRWLRRARLEQQVAQDRQEAQVLGVQLRAARPIRFAIQREKKYQTWAISELLCDWSIAAAPNDPQRALELSEAAMVAAELAPGEKRWCLRAQGVAQAHVGNAWRVIGSLVQADKNFDRYKDLWEAGKGGDPGRVLNEGRVFGLEASLRREQGRLDKALALLEQGLAVSNSSERGYLLVAKARALRADEAYEAAIATLREAHRHVDRRVPRLVFAQQFELTVNLCELEQFDAAASCLPEVSRLALQIGKKFDRLRVRWLEGRIQVGLGCLEKAVEILSVVRQEFTAAELFYDAALVAMDLAAVLIKLQRTVQVKALARQMAPIFMSQEIHAKALKALLIFRDAAESEMVTVDFVQRIGQYLLHARLRPDMEFSSRTE